MFVPFMSLINSFKQSSTSSAFLLLLWGLSDTLAALLPVILSNSALPPWTPACAPLYVTLPISHSMWAVLEIFVFLRGTRYGTMECLSQIMCSVAKKEVSNVN